MFRPPGGLTNEIADAIHHRLAQVGLQRALIARFKGLEPPQRGNHGFLNEIAGIVHAPGRGRQPTMGPAAKRRDAALQQAIERGAVADLDQLEEVDGVL